MPARFEYGRHKSRQATFEGQVNSNIPLCWGLHGQNAKPLQPAKRISLNILSIDAFVSTRSCGLAANQRLAA